MRRWLIGLSLLVCILGASALRRVHPSPAVCNQDEFLTLRAALRQRRATERFPRLTGCLGIDEQAPQGDRPHGEVSTIQLRGAAAALQRRASRGDGREEALDYAEGLVVSGQSSKALEIVVRQNIDADQRALIVRGAALTARGIETGSSNDLIEALDVDGTVLRREPVNAVALFNQALALDLLSLRHEALGAWERYERADPRSSWAAVAGTRAEALRRAPEYSRWPAARHDLLAAADGGDTRAVNRIVSEFPQAARELVDDTLLPSWADAFAGPNADAAASALARAETVSGAVERLNGDRLALAEVALLRRDLGRHEPSRLADHVDGYRLYRSARELLESDQELEAVRVFDRAKTVLRRAGNPLWMWAAVHESYASFNRYTGRDLPSAIAELSLLADAAESHRYFSVEGRTRYMIGSLEGARTNLTKALAANDKSLAVFRRIREGEYLAATEVLRASELLLLGQPQDSWNAQANAIAHVDGVISSRRRHAILIMASVRAISQKRFHAALSLLGETLAYAADQQSPNRLAEAHLHRARTLTEIHEDSGAELARAQAYIDTIPDTALRNRMHAEWLIAKGEALTGQPGADAVTPLTEGLRYFEDKTFLSRVVAIRLDRGRANLGSGRDEAAEADFRAGIATYETYRRSLSREQQRVASVDSVWDLFEDMIQLQMDRRKNPSAALAFAERARARTLLELYNRDDRIEPLRPDDLRRSMSPSTTMLYYAVLEGRVITWVLGPRTEALIDRKVDTAGLQSAVKDHLGFLQTPAWNEASRHVSERLFDELIRPVTGLVGADSTLVIVPDGFINQVAFAAIRNRDTGRFLIEDHPIVIAPSANMFIAASRSLRRRAAALDTAYIAGDPEGSLPGADREAQEIATLYRDARVDRGPSATKKRFVEAAGRYAVVHFAGHARSVPQLPFLARLEFAPEQDDASPSSLFADELRAVSFPQTQLVVLAACRTAEGETRRGEGVLSLARPVLAAGVPSVIGTLWDIDDRTSSGPLVELHRRLARGRSAPDALRDMQMASIRTPAADGPATWAAFVAIGGVR